MPEVRLHCQQELLQEAVIQCHTWVVASACFWAGSSRESSSSRTDHTADKYITAFVIAFCIENRVAVLPCGFLMRWCEAHHVPLCRFVTFHSRCESWLKDMQGVERSDWCGLWLDDAIQPSIPAYPFRRIAYSSSSTFSTSADNVKASSISVGSANELTPSPPETVSWPPWPFR
jgi:hypothetical protein